MDEWIGGLLGGALGGVLRLAPEAFKIWDRRNERAHELQMFKERCELERVLGQQKLAEIGAQREAAIDAGVVDALRDAVKQQADMAVAAGGWVAALSASVRPVLTYVMWTLYACSATLVAWAAVQQGLAAVDVARLVLPPDFLGLLAGVTNYWFLDRTLAKRGLV